MKVWEISVLIGVLLTVAILYYVLLKLLLRGWNNKVYIYPKNGRLYIPLYRCKMKNPINGEWYDAIVYQGVEDEQYYCREKDDFSGKFVKCIDINNGKKYR